MRELRSCEFCGETGARAYEVLPGTIESGPQRMVLCDDCRVTLESVVDPLLEAVSASQEPRDSNRTDAGTGSRHNPEQPSDDAGPSSSRSDSSPEEASPQSSRPADASDATSSRSDQPSEEDGITILRDDDGRSETSERSSTAGPSATEQGHTEETDTDSSDSLGTSDHATSSTGVDSDPRHQEPEGFRRAMRLLNNREFPVNRSDFIALATGAYDMDDSQVEAIIAHAVDRGVLVENGSQLERG